MTRIENRRRWAAVLLALPLLPLVALNCRRVIQAFVRVPLDSDFAQYYLISRVGLERGFGAIYDLAAERVEWTRLGLTVWFPNPDTPALAWALAPLAALPYPVAARAWTLVLVALLLLTWRLAAPDRGRLWHLGLAIAFYPVMFAVALGQVVLVVAAAVALGCHLLRRDRQVAAGLVLSAIALKPQLALVVPFALLAAGYRRAFGTWAAISLALAAAAVVSLGPAGTTRYLGRLVSAGSTVETARALLVNTDLTVRAIAHQPALAWATEALLAAVAIVVARRRRGSGPELPVAAGIVGSLLFTPFIHVQDLTMLLVAGWLHLRSRREAAAFLAVGYVAAQLATASGLFALAFEAAWLAVLASPGIRPSPSPAPPAAPAAVPAPVPSTARPAG